MADAKLADPKAIGGAGLRGYAAGETALCTVGKTGAGLTYRGYDIAVLAEKASFEEVAHLLLRGTLPTRAQLDAFETDVAHSRTLPPGVKEILERLPKQSQPMDVLRTGVSALASFEPEESFDQQQRIAVRLLGAMPSILLYWYRFSHDGVRIDTAAGERPGASHFLHLLHDRQPSATHVQVLNASLVLYAEHEFNASTFSARVCASTLSDLYSCVVAAIGTLRGPLHGGANEAAMEMMESYATPDDAEAGVMKLLAAKQKIMGFGHAVYRESDPRSPIIQKWAERLSHADAASGALYAIALRIDQVMRREKKMFTNADYYHAPAYRSLGIPTKLFTPIFACSRVSGWSAHVFEQRVNNRIIRPSADYTGPTHADWVDIDRRA